MHLLETMHFRLRIHRLFTMELVAGRTIQLQYLLRTRIVQPLGPATANLRESRQHEVRRLPISRTSPQEFSEVVSVASRNCL
jgi:hypothetical protein